MNGRLVIRVGGGYMVIDEFIATYAEVELQKMRVREEKGLDPVPQTDDFSPGKSFGSPKVSSQLNKTSKTNTSGSKSPGGNSTIKFTASDSSMNGTLRAKNYTQERIDKLRASGAARVVGSPK